MTFGFLILLICFECVVLSSCQHMHSKNLLVLEIPLLNIWGRWEEKSVKILFLGSLSPKSSMPILEGLHSIILCATLARSGSWSSSTLLLFNSSEPEMRKLEKFQWHLSSREMGVHFPKQMWSTLFVSRYQLLLMYFCVNPFIWQQVICLPAVWYGCFYDFQEYMYMMHREF